MVAYAIQFIGLPTVTFSRAVVKASGAVELAVGASQFIATLQPDSH